MSALLDVLRAGSVFPRTSGKSWKVLIWGERVIKGPHDSRVEEKNTVSGLDLGRRGQDSQDNVRHYRRGNTSSEIDEVDEGEGVHGDATGSRTGPRW